MVKIFANHFNEWRFLRKIFSDVTVNCYCYDIRKLRHGPPLGQIALFFDSNLLIFCVFNASKFILPRKEEGEGG